MTLTTNPRPVDLGAPSQFDGWRPHQWHAFEWAWDVMERHRHVGLPLATGSGKSVISFLIAKMLAGVGRRVVILTSRKGLQDQYVQDFPEIVDIRGWRNYDSWEQYQTQRSAAEDSSMVVTSYAYWIYASQFGQGIGKRDVLILDEGDSVFEQLAGLLDITIRIEMLHPWKVPFPDHLGGIEDLDSWKEWASSTALRLKTCLEELQRKRRISPSDAEDLSHLIGRLSLFAESTGEWVCERGKGHFRAVKVWPTEDIERYLLRGAEHVFWMSATLRPKSLEICGIEEMAFKEFPHPFPSEHRPVYHIPTIRAIERTTTEDDWAAWLSRIDQLIRRGGNTLGVCHVVSYKRARMVVQNSQYADSGMLLTHNSSDTSQVVQGFLKMNPPAVLVSPVLVAGWDMDEVSWACVGKLPFRSPDLGIKERRQRDKDIDLYFLCRDLVQSVGRTVRTPNASSAADTFIIDDSIGWVMAEGKRKQLIPPWFNVERTRTIPPRRF